MKKIIFIFVGLGLLGFLIVSFVLPESNDFGVKKEDLFQNNQEVLVVPKEPEKVLPIAEFKERIIKKPFGIFIAPSTSPVQPERFSGYHTGVDVEYGDVKSEVPVFSVCEGEIVFTDWVSGYGGVIGLKCELENQAVYILYGHLDQKSFTPKTKVEAGDQIAVLGKGESQETDFERKHLHFAITKKELDLRGYVDDENELKNWYRPEEFLKNF